MNENKITFDIGRAGNFNASGCLRRTGTTAGEPSLGVGRKILR